MMLCSFLVALTFIVVSHGQQERPNVIVFIMDDLGYADLGFQSNDQIKTPNIDYFRYNGRFLSRYYAQSVCSASRTALLTGRYPIHNSIYTWIEPSSSYGCPLNETLFPEELNKYGYQSHMVGKWHLGFYKWAYTPTFRGFNSFYGYYSGGENYYNHTNGNYYDFRFDSTPSCGNNCSQVASDAYGQYSTTVFTERAVDIINSHDSSKGPLFLYMAYQSVHSPAMCPSNWIAKYDNSIESSKRREFAGMLSIADDGIGNITNALINNNLFDNTIVIFTSDNGGPTTTGDGIGSLNYPLRGGKHSIWEGGTRVTSIFYASQNILSNNLRNTTYDNLMHITDWMPTVLDAIGVNPTNVDIQFDGVSQYKGLIGQTNNEFRNDVYYGCDCPDSNPYPLGAYGNSTGYQYNGYKLLNTTGGMPNTWWNGTMNVDLSEDQGTKDMAQFSIDRYGVDLSGYKLYDIINDPNEYNDIAASNMDIVNQLYNRMVNIESSMVPVPQNDPSCPAITHSVDPVVGPVWEPWCG